MKVTRHARVKLTREEARQLAAEGTTATSGSIVLTRVHPSQLDVVYLTDKEADALSRGEEVVQGAYVFIPGK